MLSNWAAIVFGWPAVMAALLAFTGALALKSRTIAVVAGIFSAPFCLWVSGYPRIQGLGLLVLVTNFLGVVALWRGQRFAAIALWTPFAMLASFLAVLVLRQRTY